ncbi:MAG: response regulator [Lachnospiraceae bacterium]|nr:response regulator [Lachnospiraceae bacterium]
MGLSIAFGISILLVIFSVIMSLREKHKNVGFIITSCVLVICDVMCILTLLSDTADQARIYLVSYYIVYGWLFFGALLTVLLTHSKKIYLSLFIPEAIICIVQSAFTIPNYYTDAFSVISTKEVFGSVYWVLDINWDSKFWLIARLYRDCCYLNAGIIFIAMTYILLHVPRVFRPKYYVLMIMQGSMFMFVLLSFTLRWPVWLQTLVMNIICYMTFYYVFLYSDFKLRESVVKDFANQMTDGLAIYNKYNDLIFVNDRLKNVVTAMSLKNIERMEAIDEWASSRETIENIEVIPYVNGDLKYYYTLKKNIVGQGDSYAGTAYIFHDCTESINRLKLMEEVNSELERTARMKADFLANMSHELRTPMNAVIGLAEIALREKEIPSNVRDCLKQINSSGRNLLNIINDVLDFSKIDSGKMEIIPEKYEPLSEVNDISHILQTRIGDKNIDFFFIVDTNLPHALYGDCMRIRQVLINLANNAIKFTEYGMVRVELTCHELDEDMMELEFHIIDTGRGIKKEDLDKLFVSFQQVDTKRNRSVEGTGLGLAISKKYVEAMGGSIGVTSEYGKGSDFWFKIPQKVVNGARDLVVDNASDKYAYCLNENLVMTDEFALEMKAFGMEGKVISSLKSYEPTGKEEFLLFIKEYYNDELKSFLDEHSDVHGIILESYDSVFKPDRPNLSVIKKPLTTLAMVLALNGKTIEDLHFNGREAKYVKFTAPDAKVLIVDDNTINLSIAVGLLEPLKVKCEVAQSGREAIDKVRENQYDLILMDHMMPEMDGVEASTEIRRTIPEADFTPIIALTANVLEGSKEQFLKAGMVDMIAKPIDIRDLNMKMIKWLPNYLIHEEKEEEAKAEEGAAETVREEELYDCLDCEKAIKGLGTVALFKKVVEDYYRNGRDTLEVIKHALEERDFDTYAIKTHSLKSTSRQIGATELGDYAEKLEKAGKESDEKEIAKYHDETMAMFEELLSSLSKYFEGDKGGDEGKPPITGEKIEEIFGKLSEACDVLDMDAMEECAAELGRFSFDEGVKEIIGELISAIGSVDPDSVTELMAKYREELT